MTANGSIIDTLQTFAQDPIVVVFGILLLALTYRLSGIRQRRLRKQRAALRVKAGKAATPRERRDLMLQWDELGGLKERQRVQNTRTAREQGQKARAAGRPLSANPYRHSLWGPGRLWKRGWKSVDRNIRWIERQR